MLPGDSLSSITSDFRIKFTDDAQANAEAVAGAIGQYADALASIYSGVLIPFQKAGEQLSTTLSRLGTLQVFSDDLNQLGGVFSRVAGLSVDLRESFIDMVGGMDTLAQQALGFAQNYYSREEIAGLKANELQKALEGAGISGVGDIKSKDDFRRLVDSTDVSTESGRSQLAALLSVSSAFVDVAEYMAETGTSLSQVSSQAPTTGAIANIINPLEAQTLATNLLTQGMDSLTSKVVELIEAIKSPGAGGGLSTIVWETELNLGTQGGA